MQEDVLSFWFEELSPKEWFKKDDALDELISERFAECHRQAVRCELADWRDSAEGRLAEIIVLDQFSRNIYRDQPQAFATDALALALAQEGVRQGADKQLVSERKAFLYMPFMHSESAQIQAQSVRLFDQTGLEANHRFAVHHKEIIDRFGRYPHRNIILGRPSSEAEIAFLQTPGSSF